MSSSTFLIDTNHDLRVFRQLNRNKNICVLFELKWNDDNEL